MKHINLMQPYIPEGTREAVDAVLRTRWIGQGPKVEEFEQRFSAATGRACVATGSCTDALHLAYLLAGIGPGDEVVCPLFTCTATNIPLLYCRAKIRFADVAPGSLNVSTETVEAAITEKTKAVVIVHYGGMQAKVKPLHVEIIEDCAQSLGNTYSGVSGSYACYSFQAVKHITTGDGGMLSLPADQVAKAKRIRWFGIDREAKFSGKWANDITEIGYKYQMTDIAAAMGLAGMDSLDAQMDHRRALRSAYMVGLDRVDGIKWLDNDPQSACWLATVLADDRDALKRKLNDNRVEADQVHYRNDRYSIFAASRGEFPNMDAVDGKYLCLPMHMGLTVEDVGEICNVVRSGW